MNPTATASPVSPVLGNGRGPILRAGMFRLRRAIPLSMAAIGRPIGRAHFQQLRVCLAASPAEFIEMLDTVVSTPALVIHARMT